MTVEEWSTIFNECFDNPDLTLNDNATMIHRLAVKLAWSDPTSIFDKGRWKDKKLVPANDTNAWLATYFIMGAP